MHLLALPHCLKEIAHVCVCVCEITNMFNVKIQRSLQQDLHVRSAKASAAH